MKTKLLLIGGVLLDLQGERGHPLGAKIGVKVPSGIAKHLAKIIVDLMPSGDSNGNGNGNGFLVTTIESATTSNGSETKSYRLRI